MRVNDYTLFLRKSRNFAEQFTRTTNRESGRKTAAHTIIRGATKQGLTKMNVRLYKSWQHGAPMRFDHFGYSVVNLTANFGDASVADQHITALDGIIFIHRHNCAALDENRFGH